VNWNALYSRHKKKVWAAGISVSLWLVGGVLLNRPIMDAQNPARHTMGPMDGECYYSQTFTFGEYLPVWEHVITVSYHGGESCQAAFDREFGHTDRFVAVQHPQPVQPVAAIQAVQAQSGSPQNAPEHALLTEARAAISNTRFQTIPIPSGYLKQFGIKSKEHVKVLDTASDGSVTFLQVSACTDPEYCGNSGENGIQVWQQVVAKYNNLLDDRATTVGMLSTSTGGHRDLVLQSKHMLNIYKFNGAAYKPTQCFEDEDMAGNYVLVACLPVSTGQ